MPGPDSLSENAPVQEEAVIDAFLDGNPRAQELRTLRAALEQRRAAVRHDLAGERDVNLRSGLQLRLEEMNAQIAALHQEEAITEFVESSVRMTLHRPAFEELEE